MDSLVTLSTELLASKDASNEDLNVHKNAVKMYMFLLRWFLSSAKKSTSKTTTKKKASPTKGAKGGRGRKANKKDESGPSWETDNQKENILSAMIHVLEMDLSRLWKMTYPEDEFLNLFATTAYSMLEDSTNTKCKPVKKCIFMLISLLAKKYNQGLGVVNSLINLLHQFEHLPSVIAELMEVMVNEYHCEHIVGDIVR